MPFDGAYHTETIGYAGGLWMLWNSDRMEVTPLSSIEQEIHAVVKVRNSNSSWMLIAVYASPRTAERHILWNNLAKVFELHNMPWVVVGDFNEPLIGKDKFGGRTVSVNRSLLFKECLDKCSMIDIGFSSPRFTWTNRRDLHGLIQERIDRFFVNPSWCLLYPEAKVVHLTRCHSDHCPVLLKMQPRGGGGRNRPFKYQTCWLSNPSFPAIVSRSWSQSEMLVDAISKFTDEATRWNRMQFWNIFNRKKNIMARLNGIQRALANRPSTFLINLENELIKELDVVLNQEEEIWALESRVNWLVQGDRNTNFYHVSTLVRRKQNQILAIKDSVGEWIFEERAIKEHIRNGFEGIYTSSFSCVTRAAPSLSRWQVSLSEEEKHSIGGVASEDEIKVALWSLKAFKVPGLDGLHAGFFHRFWLIVGSSVVSVVKKVFLERKVSNYLNKTHIALIPKIQGSETIANYRPISLCNTVYKIITKIIVAQIRPHLDKLISPIQAAFVPRRKGVDNAIIVQEVIHSLSKKKRKVGYMTLTIDLDWYNYELHIHRLYIHFV